MGLGIAVLLALIGVDLWRFVLGQFVAPKPAINRWWDTVFNLWALFIAVNVAAKAVERSLRFAFGLFSVVFVAHMGNLFLPLTEPIQKTLLLGLSLAEIAAFVFLVIFVATWFRSKIVHV